MHGITGQENYVAGLHRQRDGPICGENLFGDLLCPGEFGAVAVVAGTVSQQALFVAARHHVERPLFDRGILE